ncbi:TRAP transporter, DctM subunit [Paracoccus thiocyanatus]|uniref:TRAP transporter, DctM subunit n=1 Tax=Paracoccus thiocyanatus TaxID=34006 RepID=A0A1N6SW59_9RHOB|nr:TRAP transporter large permease subunit [Paracoccus thiocyanatus]SIQ45254.1 TRAP transporter, DctM subunit [Paracoccus thiocyanatus]
MMIFIAQNMAPIMFASLVVFLLFGYPVAFALAANGLFFFVIGVELAPLSGGVISLDWPLLGTLPNRMWQQMSNDTMLAIPFFTFMGIVLEKSGMAEDLLDTIGQLFGPIRGGLAYAVILVGALLAATTGVVAASVIAMGLISLPIMLRYGYDRRVASGVIASSGTLAQIVPPSLVLIVLADQLTVDIGSIYAGALLPSLVLAGSYAAFVFVLSLVRPDFVPALPPQARTLGSGVASLLVVVAIAGVAAFAAFRWLHPMIGSDADILGVMLGAALAYVLALADRYLKLGLMSHLAQQVVIVLIPPLALIFLVLGTIFLGIAAPTEGGAMGAAGALILAIAKKRMTWSLLRQALENTARLSAFVMFIIMGARVFSLTFYGVNGHLWIEHLLVSLPGGEMGFVFFVSVLVFFLAFFLDYFELAFIIVPLLVMPAKAIGIDLVWFGVILALVMQTSFMHPPFGFSLHFLRSVAPRRPYADSVTGRQMQPVTTGQIYAGAIPFMLIQLAMAVAVALFPSLVTDAKPERPAAQTSFELPSLGGTLPPPGPPAGLGAPAGLDAPAGLGDVTGGLPGLAAPPGLAPTVQPPAPAIAPAGELPGLDPPT